MPTELTSPPITQGTVDPAQVEAEQVTNAAPAAVRNASAQLPSTGAGGTNTMLLYAAGFVVAGGLLLAARRRVAGAVID